MAIPLTARAPVEFTPPSLPDRLKGLDPGDETKHRVRILVRVATMFERDSYQAALVRGGVQYYNRQQLQELALAGTQVLFPENAEEKQTLLRELWAKRAEDAQVQALELEILREEHEKAVAEDRDIDLDEVKRRTAEIQRETDMDPQREIEASALSQEIIARYKPLGEVVAASVEQDAKRAWLNARVYVIGWTGLEHELDAPPGPGGLKGHEVEYLRGEIGADAFSELSDFITSVMTISEDEEKNLASLLADMSAPIGSTQSESTESSEDGNSTDGPSTSTQEAGSAKTTSSSSSSSTSSGTPKAASKAGRTAKRSSTSQKS